MQQATQFCSCSVLIQPQALRLSRTCKWQPCKDVVLHTCQMCCPILPKLASWSADTIQQPWASALQSHAALESCSEGSVLLQYYGGDRFFTNMKKYKGGCDFNSIPIFPHLHDACEELRSARAAEAARLSELARETPVQQIYAEKEHRQVCCLCNHSPAFQSLQWTLLEVATCESLTWSQQDECSVLALRASLLGS